MGRTKNPAHFFMQKIIFLSDYKEIKAGDIIQTSNKELVTSLLKAGVVNLVKEHTKNNNIEKAINTNFEIRTNEPKT